MRIIIEGMVNDTTKGLDGFVEQERQFLEWSSGSIRPIADKKMQSAQLANRFIRMSINCDYMQRKLGHCRK